MKGFQEPPVESMNHIMNWNDQVNPFLSQFSCPIRAGINSYIFRILLHFFGSQFAEEKNIWLQIGNKRVLLTGEV